MPLNKIESILKEAMGLNAASIGSSAIKRAIDLRMSSLDITDVDSYAEKLSLNQGELAELIELVVIPETWFFRDMNPFTALVNTLSKIGKGRPGTPLRILSVPCSTGEEPYTIAMALDKAGFDLNSVSIHAIDISSRNISLARRAQYTNNSFRSSNLDFRDRYFHQTRHGYHLKPEIKECVDFSQENILDPAFAKSRGSYDVIFCRNLLIYFDRATQVRAIDVLESLLLEDGLMFLGHAESGVVTGRSFETLPFERCFGFKRVPKQEKPVIITALKSLRNKTRTATRRPTQGKPSKTTSEFFTNPHKAASPTVECSPSSSVEDINTTIIEAEKLANEGHLVEAANLCETYLQTVGTDASAYYLLGLIREATGENNEAINYLRKAIYLDPQHLEAMTHLALILSRKGQKQEADRMQARADRISQRKTGEA